MKRAFLAIIAVLFVIMAGMVLRDSFTRAATNDAVADAVKRYEIVKQHGNVFERYACAKLVAAAYLQVNDEANYQKWKSIETADAKLAGLPVPSDSRAAEEFQRYQETRPRDSMDELLAASKERLNNPLTTPVAQPPAEAPPKYTPQMKEKMRAAALADMEAGERQRREAAEAAARPIEKAMLEAKAREEKRQRLLKAFDGAQYRPWITLGGKEASQAKVIAYDKGVVTLEKRDGKTVEVRVSKMGRADREYMEKWLDDAGL